MLSFLRDCRYALRQLYLWPGFAATVIITLALGIGVNTAIFSAMNVVLFRTLPVRDPERLFYLTHPNMPLDVSNTGDSRNTFGINVYNRLREDGSAFSDVIAYVPLSLTQTAVRYGNTPEEAEADEVSGNFFLALGVGMVAGEPFIAADENIHSPVAVLSYRYWTRRFNRDVGVIGHALYIEGVPFTIIGVAKEHFYGIESGGIATDIWIPLQSRPDVPAWGTPAHSDTLYGSPNWWNLMLLVRLAPGIAQDQAIERANAVFEHAAYETAGKPSADAPKLALILVPAKGLGTASIHYREPMLVLILMAGMVLLIACVNISLLLVMRSSARQRDFGLRQALGASRWSLFHQLFLEGLVMVVVGTIAGWLIAVAGTRLLGMWAGLEVSLAPNFRVLFFTVAISAVAAFLFGLAPLRTATGAPDGSILKGGVRATSSTKGKVRANRIVVAAQMSLCVPLLFGTGLLVHTLRNYQNVDLGMRADQVLAFGLHPMGTQSKANNLSFYKHVIERLSRLPGVTGVTVAENRPGAEWSDNNDLIIDNQNYTSVNDRTFLRTNSVGPDFFKTLGILLLAGRDISEMDTDGAPAVAVVNQTLVRRYLKDANPIGHTLGDPKHLVTIVGVARDSKYTEAGEEPMPMAWYSYQQGEIGDMDVEVRAANPMALVRAVRSVMTELNPDISLANLTLLKKQFEQSYVASALFARLAILFGGLAAVLVATGLYGLLAYRVRLRTFEIGIRIALGATRWHVLWLVLRESLLLATVGCVVGLPLTVVASQLMVSMLYGLSNYDPLSFVAAVLVTLLIALSAAFVPSYKAAVVEPINALRAE